MTLPLTTPGFTDAEHSKRLINKTFTYVADRYFCGGNNFFVDNKK